jgi:hypothetical protein
MKLEVIHLVLNRLLEDIIDSLDNLTDLPHWEESLTVSYDKLYRHNLGMELVIKKDLSYLPLYIDILEIIANLEPIKIIDLLSMRNIRQQTFGQLIGLCEDKEIEKAYFRLLKKLASDKDPAVLYRLLNNKLLAELPIGLIKNGLDLIDDLAKHKKAIKHYILLMPEITETDVAEKIAALKRAVNENDAVGELFYVQRGVQECDVSKGTLAELQDVLNKLTKPKRQFTDTETYARFFWQPKAGDIKPFNSPTVQCDSYLELGL